MKQWNPSTAWFPDALAPGQIFQRLYREKFDREKRMEQLRAANARMLVIRKTWRVGFGSGQGPSSQGGVTLGRFWNIVKTTTFLVISCEQSSKNAVRPRFPMSLLCFFLVAQLFPTQAASHSQQLAEGGPPLKAETFCWSNEVLTMVQLDQIASMAGKTQYAISPIYFLVKLVGLGINRLHSGAVHLFITLLLALRPNFIK